MPRRHIREKAPHTEGAVQTWLDEHDTALDALEASSAGLNDEKYWVGQSTSDLSAEMNLGALTTGLVLNTVSGSVGTPSRASEGIDYSKGPWKAFSTVRNVAPAQTLSIPVVAGNANGIIRASGRLISDGTDRNVTVKINGSATDVSMQYNVASNTTVSGARVCVCSTGLYGAFFDLVMFAAKTANGLKRFGLIRVCVANSATIVTEIYNSAFHYNDVATAITSIDLDCGHATGFAANTEALVEEGIVS